MNATDAIALGLLQGVTEFLPISSSAHLVAGQALLGVESPGVLLEVALHFGTLMAILVVLWRTVAALLRDSVVGAFTCLTTGSLQSAEQKAPLFPTALAIAVGSVPVAVAGIAFEESVERTFDSLSASGALLFVTGLILLTLRFAPPPRTQRVGPGRGFLVGLAQAFALLPGISRSGITITTSCLLGVAPKTSARFSFLLAVPALAGATVWKARQGLTAGLGPASLGDATGQAVALALGIFLSAASGAACLLVLLRIVERGRLHWFAAYCLPAGAVMFAAGLLS
ncbi:MAG: undecaprenyl-diphosphate phosphatase [Candidatus Brocadiae bacterium]|nr:undecaprenyl-diphosphate phosphatase [Candidatus Brocadiia bacterium]